MNNRSVQKSEQAEREVEFIPSAPSPLLFYQDYQIKMGSFFPLSKAFLASSAKDQVTQSQIKIKGICAVW